MKIEKQITTIEKNFKEITNIEISENTLFFNEIYNNENYLIDEFLTAKGINLYDSNDEYNNFELDQNIKTLISLIVLKYYYYNFNLKDLLKEFSEIIENTKKNLDKILHNVNFEMLGRVLNE